MLSRGGASVRIKDHPGGGNKSYSLPSIKKKNLKTFCSNSPKKALFFTKSSAVVVLMIKSRNFEVLPLACKLDISEFHASLKTPVPRVKEVIFIRYLIIGVFVFFNVILVCSLYVEDNILHWVQWPKLFPLL